LGFTMIRNPKPTNMTEPKPDPISRARKFAWPTVAVGAALWGTDLLLRPRLLNGGMHPAEIVLGEHVLLTLIFVPTLFRFREESGRLRRGEWVGLLFLAWGGSAIATIMLTAAYSNGHALTATLLQKLQSPIAVGLAGVVLKERRSALFWGFFGLAMVAAYLISFGFRSLSDVIGSGAAWPTVYAIGAAGIWGACTVVGRISLRHTRPSVVTGWRFVLALPLLLALNVRHLANGSIASSNSHWSNLWPLLLIVILPDALGMTLYYIGLNNTPASLATLAELAYPISALVLGLSFGGQSMNVGQWVGLGMLLLCLHGIQVTHSVSTSNEQPVDGPQELAGKP